jgi:hypothetical protein
MYFYGREESYPGRVVYKVPYLGLPVLAVGDASVFVYLVLFCFGIFSLIQAGKAAKQARLANKPSIVRKQMNKSQ